MPRLAATLLFSLVLANSTLATAERWGGAGRRLAAAAAEVTCWNSPLALHAQGPGALFESVEAAAIDALTYAYLQARDARDTGRMRGGTIHPVGDRYSYGEIHLAKPWLPDRISYPFRPQEVARFHVYPRYQDLLANRANERLSRVDRRSVSVIDPLHRTLYVLHPSAAIRAYRGEDPQRIEVTNLRRQQRSLLFADN